MSLISNTNSGHKLIVTKKKKRLKFKCLVKLKNVRLIKVLRLDEFPVLIMSHLDNYRVVYSFLFNKGTTTEMSRYQKVSPSSHHKSNSKYYFENFLRVDGWFSILLPFPDRLCVNETEGKLPVVVSV